MGKIRIQAFGIAVAPGSRQILYTQDDRNSTDITLVENSIEATTHLIIGGSHQAKAKSPNVVGSQTDHTTLQNGYGTSQSVLTVRSSKRAKREHRD
jgi:hypothetical protein